MPAVSHRGRGRRTINEINMVPFIDVMLVLLIIFMVTAPLITPSMIDLPSVGKASRQPDQIIQIVLGKNDSLEMKVKDTTTSLTLKDLASAVKNAQGPRDAAVAASSAVVISADKNVKYESVVRVMDTLQRAGIQRVGLSVQLAN
ncbi:MAG: biopolymer transporter ExbD [Pseudomonadota bacterium]